MEKKKFMTNPELIRLKRELNKHLHSVEEQIQQNNNLKAEEIKKDQELLFEQNLNLRRQTSLNKIEVSSRNRNYFSPSKRDRFNTV